jgi:hypothetical protein
MVRHQYKYCAAIAEQAKQQQDLPSNASQPQAGSLLTGQNVLAVALTSTSGNSLVDEHTQHI